MDAAILTALLACLAFLCAIVFVSRGTEAPAYWALSWGAMILSGILLSLDLSPAFDQASPIAASLFPGLQLAGAYRYVQRRPPRWILPAALIVAGVRSGVALLGHHGYSHLTVLPVEIGLLVWGAAVVLRSQSRAHEPMDWLLAISAILLCGLETMDAINDIGLPSGSALWVPWLAIGAIVGVLQTVGVDERLRRVAVEKQRQHEERQRTAQRLESLGVMAGGIAHDFNNLLATILGNAELALLELGDDAPARAPVDQVIEGTLLAAELSGQMLAYAAGRGLEPEAVDLGRMLQDRSTLLRSAVGTGIALDVSSPDGLPTIQADPSQLAQVLLNLVINAGEACNVKGSRVRIAVESVEIEDEPPATVIGELPPGPYLQLSVADDGPGLGDSTASQIFDPFFTTKFTGRGMGLAITQQVVRAHRGAVAVHSGSGGTRFDVYLPADPASTPHDAGANGARSSGTAQIVAIDDQPAVLSVVRRALESAGHQVTTLTGGREAIAALGAGSPLDPALLILDATMPDIGAREVIQFARREHPALPILMMTGHDTERLSEEFANQAIIGWIRKPFRLAELRDRVAECLGAPPASADEG